MASRLLARVGEGDDRVFLYVDNHLRPHTGQHVIRKGWRMQERAVPGTTNYYVHDEEGCPLWRMSTTSHDSLCAWLMPVVEFAKLSLGDEVKRVLVFDRGGAFPETMAELREAGAEFVTYERELMALRATVPAVAPVSETPLAGKLRRHELGYKTVLDTLRTALANLESDLAILLAKHLDRPREAKKLLATLFASPGTVHVGARAVTVRLMPGANSERAALRAFLADIAHRRFSLPGDPDRRRVAWAIR